MDVAKQLENIDKNPRFTSRVQKGLSFTQTTSSCILVTESFPVKSS